MRVLMTGGGTGGHVNPALAIAGTIKDRMPDAEIAFVGTKRGLENTLVPREGYKLYHVDVRGFARKLSVKNIRAAWLALVSPVKAKKVIKEFKPDIVVGTGGYVSWPVLVAASRMGIPTAVHESNAVPGLAVRKLIPYVDRIFVNFKVTSEKLGASASEKVMHVGCPVADGVGGIDRKAAREKLGIPASVRKCLLSFGGSLGAKTLNGIALELMSGYVSMHPEVRYIHACGAAEYDEVNERFIGLGLDRYSNIELVRYIYDMPWQLAAADLVICRSGAITCSELSHAGRASILIPSPNVTDNQQVRNAEVLEACGGALMIEEKDLEPGRITESVGKLLSVPGMTEEMGRRVRTASPDDANERIFDEIIRLTSGRKSGK